MVTQVSLDCELCLCPDNLGNKDGNSSNPSSSQEQAAPQLPAKKPTRQWAAWTRQEEESFFAALRQVGKNFEKITSRVQSKNKDQVRHYYYRLVRRMNKLLGPELCLDAKNSKDTNAAMLRWWSLLEKYSCKASKLHLKPRRFKIFVETLENQLLRDRKKNTKKRLSTGENNTSVANITNQVRASGPDSRAVKMVLLDNQNIEKVGTGKGSLFKRPANIGINRTNFKVDQAAAIKTVKHRRKNGLASAAAYKRWEKAAIAGVSLVADAAEQLERVDTDKETEYQEAPGHNGAQLVGEMACSLQTSARSTPNEDNSQKPSKLKLQLFPIDEFTQKDLEMNQHNPYLELTLSTRKKISSVVEHLNRKWGNSRLLDQELMLFPYWAQRENLLGYQRWSKDSTLCAADVHYRVGSPPVFRLRYGWFSKAEIESATAQALSCTNVNEARKQTAESKNPSRSSDHRTVSAEPIITPTPSSASTPIITVACDIPVSNVNTSRYPDSTAVVSSLPRKESGDLTYTRQVENTKDMPLSAGEWADSLTNISMGELLSESTPITANCSDFPGSLGSNYQQIPFNCDSFDAAIAAHIFKHQTKVQQQGLASHAPSIFDAEETCDAFSFQKTSAFFRENHSASMKGSSETRNQPPITSPSVSLRGVEELPGAEKLTNNDRTCEGLLDECELEDPIENPTKDFSGLTDYWPDSLGPLDLDIPSCRYQSNDLILSDSLGGLNRLIANSLDAFQSCSFFGSEKKEAATKAETHQNASFSDFKIGSEV